MMKTSLNPNSRSPSSSLRSFDAPSRLTVMTPLTASPTSAPPEKEKCSIDYGKGVKLISNTFLHPIVARWTINCLSWWPSVDTVAFWMSGICYKQTKNLSAPHAMWPTVAISLYLSQKCNSLDHRRGKIHLITERVRGDEIGIFWAVTAPTKKRPWQIK